MPLLLLLFSIPLFAQNEFVLSVPGQVKSGVANTGKITLNTVTPSAVQWELVLPTGWTLSAAGPIDTQKTASCYLNRCILYGGRTELAAGDMTTLAIVVPRTAINNAYYDISLKGIVAASAAGYAIALKQASVVTVRTRVKK